MTFGHIKGCEYMDLSEDDILLIMRLIEESDFDELNLQMDDITLVVRKHGSGDVSHEFRVANSAPSALSVNRNPSKESAAGTPKASETEGPAISEAKRDGPVSIEEGLIAVTAPMLGTFYRSPRPGAPPFVKVGSFVTEDDTVCLIEVMKVFSAVRAQTKGYITSIVAENGAMVEYGQTLLLVKPGEKKVRRKKKAPANE